MMHVSLAQFEVARADAAANLARIAELAAEASAAGSDLLCLPEMCTTGFDWAYNRAHLSFAAEDAANVAGFAQQHGIAICGSMLEQTESGNAANCFHYFDARGTVCARYRKLHLFTLFHEERHVEAGHECVCFDSDFGPLGAGICYDLRFPELFRRNTEAGARLHLLPAAFPHPRLEHWRTLVRARAIENQTYFIAINQCGVEGHDRSVGETQYFGHSMVVDPWGEIVAEAGEDACLLQVEIDPSLVSQVRSKLSAWEDRRADLFSF
ncbi:nitrilase-related carbon-nitrogen hydrolase [Coraliomargarita algicola]|uniref:Nitrilase-related carbon-nitrogen hydrolase n=1 Tax=Coraliomargarita algicola TaxID=3092156 RepID=A0ABZ0RHT1_9BACT|nr:nitrilase-related carbon-nitrogen hydrolase [Coraliomargarita sp. J2-16]WPJ95759.1 nitrilase-related carbon-nitrogen hydrolase [Coraliomargarita sp. J2-16]